MKRRGKLGGQNKVPRIITKQDLFEDIQEFAKEWDVRSIANELAPTHDETSISQ
jgi:hypothetical protein